MNPLRQQNSPYSHIHQVLQAGMRLKLQHQLQSLLRAHMPPKRSQPLRLPRLMMALGGIWHTNSSNNPVLLQ